MALLLIKVSLLLGAALGVARLLRRTPAATRHTVWTLAFAALLALPLLAYGLPAVHVPVPAAWRTPAPLVPAPAPDVPGSSSEPDRSAIASGAAPHAPGRTAANGERTAWRPAIDAADLFIALWALGTLVAVSALVLSLLRVRRLARTATELTDERWLDAAADAACRAGLRRRPRLVTSDGVRTPMAGGLTKPTVFLPSAAGRWTEERRDVVLAHEIAHLARRDPLRHVAARLAVALYWFHPLAWFAAREASVAREQACDEAVLALGLRPSSYARVLLDFADSSPARALTAAALPIVERSLLERRLMAILNDDVRRTTRTRALIPVAALGVLAMALAAARPAVYAAMPDVLRGTTLDTAAPAQAAPRDAAVSRSCDALPGNQFRGTMSRDDSGGRTVVYDMVGTSGADSVILRSFGELRICMIAEGIGGVDDGLRPSEWPARARHVVIEARRGGSVQRLDTTLQPGGVQRVVWFTGGAERPFDAAAQQWRERMAAVLDTTWEISSLRGQVSSLHGEISSIRGQESSLRGEISSLMGEVSSMRGRISSIRGEESSLRGQISSIEGHVSSLRGSISSAQGSISSLQSARFDQSDAERAGISTRVRAQEVEIARLRQDLRDYGAAARIEAVERELRALDSDGKVAAIEAEIRAFDLDGKVAAIEQRIGTLDVTGKTAGLERSVAALDADRRVRQLDERLTGELKALQDAVARIR